MNTPILRSLLFALTAWLIAYAATLGGSPTLHAATNPTPWIEQRIAVLRDPGGQLTIDDVAATALQSRFVAQPGSGVTLGYTRDAVWLRITLQRAAAAPANWWIETDDTSIDDYRFYARDSDGRPFLSERDGDLQPFSARVTRYRHPLFRVVLPDDRPHEFYLRVESTSSLTFALTPWQSGTLRLAVQGELLAFGLAFGVLATTVLVSLLCGIVIRDPRYFVFVGCTLYFTLLLATTLGFTAMFALPDAPHLVDAIDNINVCLIPAAFLVFVRQVLRLDEFASRLDTWAKYLAIFSLLAPLAVAGGAFRLIAPLMLLATLLAIGINLRACWLAHRLGRAGATFFLAGAIAVLLPSASSLLTALGVLPMGGWIEAGMVISIVLFCLLVHLGLLTDIKIIHDERLHTGAAITHSRALAEQERRLREEQTRFFALVAHELRNPLGILVSGVANLRLDLANAGEPARQRVARMARAVRRLADLIDRHLRLQRLTHPDFVPDYETCSPEFPAELALERVLESHPDCHIEFAVADALPPEITIDAELVALAIANLLDNAIKYSPTGSAVTLNIARDGTTGTGIAYRVSDHGPGIAPSYRERLFDLYVRQPGKPGTGFGIGLALVAKVARHHGGRVDCQSVPGAGATFELCLPVAPQPHCARP